MTPRNRIAGLLAASAIATGTLLVATAGPALAAECGAKEDVTVRDGLFKKAVGEAHYTIRCSGSQIVVDGYVVDTAADGKCVETKSVNSDNPARIMFTRACGKGTARHFTDEEISNSGVAVYSYAVLAENKI